MANIVKNRLTVRDEKTEESRESLLDFERRGREVYILEDTAGWGEVKELVIGGKRVPYILEDLGMQNFFPQEGKARGGGPMGLLYPCMAEKRIDSSGGEESRLVYTYDTKEEPNGDFVLRVSELYPDLTFTHHFHGEAAQFSGNRVCRRGEVLLDEYSGVTDFLLFENGEDYRGFVELVEEGRSEYRLKEGLGFPEWEGGDGSVQTDRISLHYAGDTGRILTICVEGRSLEETQEGIAGVGYVIFA